MAPISDVARASCHELVTEMQTDPFTACTKLYRQLCKLERACGSGKDSKDAARDSGKDANMVALEQNLPKYQDALQTAMVGCFEGDASNSDGILAVTMLTQAVLAARVAKHTHEKSASGEHEDKKRGGGGPAARRQQQSTVARTITRLVNALTKFSEYSSAASATSSTCGSENDGKNSKIVSNTGDGEAKSGSDGKSELKIVTSGVVPRAFLTSLGVLMDLGSASMCPWRNQVEKLVPVLEQCLFSSDEWISKCATDALVQLTWLALPVQNKNNDDSQKEKISTPLMEELIVSNLKKVEELTVSAIDRKKPAMHWDMQCSRRVELVSALLLQGCCPSARYANQWSTYAQPTDCVLRVPGRCFDLTSRIARLLVLPTSSAAAKERLVRVGQAVLNLFSSAVKCTGRGGALACADVLHKIVKDLLMVPSDVMRLPEWSNAILTVCTTTPSFFLDRNMFKLALRSCTTHIENISNLEEIVKHTSLLTYANACRALANVLKVGGVRIHGDEFKNLFTALAKLVWTDNKISHVCNSEVATLATFDLLDALCGAGATKAPLQLGGRHVVFALLERLSQNAPATTASFGDVRARASEVWRTWAVHLTAGNNNHTFAKRAQIQIEIPGAEEFVMLSEASTLNSGVVLTNTLASAISLEQKASNKRSADEIAQEVKKAKLQYSSEASVEEVSMTELTESRESKKESAEKKLPQDDKAEVSKYDEKDVEMSEVKGLDASEKVTDAPAQHVEEQEDSEDEDEEEEEENQVQAQEASLLGLDKIQEDGDDDDAMSEIPDIVSDDPDADE